MSPVAGSPPGWHRHRHRAWLPALPLPLAAALAAGLAPSPLSSAPRDPGFPSCPPPVPAEGSAPGGSPYPAGGEDLPVALLLRRQGRELLHGEHAGAPAAAAAVGAPPLSPAPCAPLPQPHTAHTPHTHTHLPGSGLGGLRILSARPPAPSRLLRPIITNLGEKAAASPPLSHTKALPLGDELGDSPRGHVSPLRDLPRGAVGTVCVPPGQPSGGGSRARPSPPPQ